MTYPIVTQFITLVRSSLLHLPRIYLLLLVAHLRERDVGNVKHAIRLHAKLFISLCQLALTSILRMGAFIYLVLGISVPNDIEETFSGHRVARLLSERRSAVRRMSLAKVDDRKISIVN